MSTTLVSARTLRYKTTSEFPSRGLRSASSVYRVPASPRPIDRYDEPIVGDSDALQSIMSRVDQVASTNATALLLGETGTGKELIAREIHRRSARCGRPLVV